MNAIRTSKKGLWGLLVFTTILFICVSLVCWETTALSEYITVGWSIVAAFIKSYLLIIALYFCFRVRQTYVSQPEEFEVPLSQSLQKVLQVLQNCFLLLLLVQIGFHLWGVWHELKLYPLELEVWESIWTLIRYLIGLMGTWILEFWFWLGKQLRISFILNNPCLGGICLEEYPWVSLILTVMLGYILKQLWKISIIRFSCRFFFHIVYSIAKVVVKFFLRKLSRKAASHLSSAVLLQVAQQTISEIHGFYRFPLEETKQVIE